MPPKAKEFTQLGLYLSHNIKHFENVSTNSLKWNLQDVFNMIPAYLGVFPETLLKVLRTVKNSNGVPNRNVDYRNTTLADMDASKFNVDTALDSLRRLREVNKNVINTVSKSHFSTRTSNRTMRENNLPSDRISRAVSLAGLMLNIASSTTKDVIQRVIKGEDNAFKNSITSDKNVEIIVECLCKMRGTALKFGQLLSLQYDILPENFRRALISARHKADVMSKSQVDMLMCKEFGNRWNELFSEFSYEPTASASIGQAHRGKLLNGDDVIVKIQFPGVLDSIDSDLNNLMLLCTYTNLIPERFFIDQFTKEMKVELTTECNYMNEARFYGIFRELKLDGFYVPRVIPELTTTRVITTELVRGISIEETVSMDQEIRDSICERFLKLGLSEIFIFGLMNTDPNPSNYLYNSETNIIGLIDFGSCRMFKQEFIDEYFKLVSASRDLNEEQIFESSFKLGFLNTNDRPEAINAHVNSVIITGEPFRFDGLYDFGKSEIIKKCLKHSKTILKYREQPPPPEVYSLHRKLAGCYVICTLLSARVNAKKIFDEISAAFKQ